MFRIYPDEEFREVAIPFNLRKRYAVSNRGRIISFTDDIRNGDLLKGGLSDGYKTLHFKTRIENKVVNKNILIYRIVAELFIPQPSEEHKYILHLDHDRSNDVVKNLVWATYEEKLAHHRKSPHVIKAKKNLIEYNLKADGRKLTVTKVIHIKKLLQDPNRKTRLKMLAKQFGVSEMQIRRIQSGENWSTVVV
ncbi:MAG: hypothetical protein CFE23_09770 [Flavobacterium sp. BFFFF1]|uniref:NUMOD4 domain-containing protein n=1 Tax=unclassified Flavobacterium TaxID=196869 RepID=UPI000BD9A61C|nr:MULTISPECIES: NUMOD4 domain-containing protein [unclassified Flavobacterium]OYU80343.1 MAG: hypothetical protein CFE23_09770 [Flavobacterium sp. BFFFF1]